jgi:hypothetical protein
MDQVTTSKKILKVSIQNKSSSWKELKKNCQETVPFVVNCSSKKFKKKPNSLSFANKKFREDPFLIRYTEPVPVPQKKKKKHCVKISGKSFLK